MKKRNKKAQFYLIASIVILALFLSFVSLLNYSLKRNNLDINRYAEELNLEGKKVLDYDLATGDNQFEEFAKSYSYYVGGEREIYFIVGEQGSLDSFRYDGESRVDHSSDLDVVGSEVTLGVDGRDFTFEIKPGENFYFVMSDEYRNQEYFVTN